MEQDILFPEARQILEEAQVRHAGVLAYTHEAIDLAHIAYRRQRDLSALVIPGVPCVRRVRNEINDDTWRFIRAIGDPLVEAGLIRDFVTVDNGDMMIMPDGLHMRIKKGSENGNTSNYPTGKIVGMAATTENVTLFSAASRLDVAIQEGIVIDVVFVAAEAHGEYNHVGMRFAVAEASPFLSIDAPTEQALRGISPTAHDLVADARAKLAS